MKKMIQCFMGVMLAVGLAAGVCGCGTKVSDFRAQKFQEIKSKVEHEPAWVYLMQKILDARHGSVRAKAIEVEDLKVNLLGDDVVVKGDQSNLKSLDAKFRVTWDGTFHKNGFTCMTIVFDKDWNVKRLIPGETNAKIDLASGDPANRKPGAMKAVLQKAKAKYNELKPKVAEAVEAAKAKVEELKPQVKEELKKLEQQVDEALLRLSEELQ